ncbi:hypothetical protein GCM10027035_10810 [Emticicia sediminis]
MKKHLFIILLLLNINCKNNSQKIDIIEPEVTKTPEISSETDSVIISEEPFVCKIDGNVYRPSDTTSKNLQVYEIFGVQYIRAFNKDKQIAIFITVPPNGKIEKGEYVIGSSDALAFYTNELILSQNATSLGYPIFSDGKLIITTSNETELKGEFQFKATTLKTNQTYTVSNGSFNVRLRKK